MIDSDSNTSGCPIIGVGASAGGLEAITTMIRKVPQDSGLAFIIVLHLDPNHESMMAELLSRETMLSVRQASEGDSVTPDCAYVIPPGVGITISDGVLHLTKFDEPRGLRRPIDDLFKSLALDQGTNAACVILSGTGADGSVGLQMIRDHGGLCVAQSISTARYPNMPAAAIATGAVDMALPPEEIVSRLIQFFQHRNVVESAGDIVSNIMAVLPEICAQLHGAVDHDFSDYKNATLIRRVERRMQVLGLTSVKIYVERLTTSKAECITLFNDLLINVTRFFRDSQSFDVLKRRAIEPIIASVATSEVVRVWVPGCSTGQEAYTIAMLLLDAMERIGTSPLIQIFATDVDEKALSVAREAFYSSSLLDDIPEYYRDRYMIYRDSGVQIAPKIRDLIRFSSHNILVDPAFSRLDLVSCRNLLIYFDERAQQTALANLSYALRPGGFLFLGPSESLGRYEEQFSPVDHKARLFRRRENLAAPISPLRGFSQLSVPRQTALIGQPLRNQSEWSPENIAERRLLDRFCPAYIIVDDRGLIISSSGRLARYFDIGGGNSQMQAIPLARKGLRAPLSRLFREARIQRTPVVQRDILVRSEFGAQKIDLVVDPLPDTTLLVVFLEKGAFEVSQFDDLAQVLEPRDRVFELEEELDVVRLRLHSAVEELETANEELKSSNEEMMSMNEELQSTNEELTTVNDELTNKINQIASTNDDIKNFLASTDLAIVVVDRNLHIRTFTDPIRNIFPLLITDIGRNLNEIKNLSDDNEILSDTLRVIRECKEVRRLVWSKNKYTCYQLRILPYRRLNSTLDGATLTFSDVTQLRTIQDNLRHEQERLQLALDAGGMGVWDYDYDRRVINLDSSSANLHAEDAHGDRPLDSILSKLSPVEREVFLKGLEQVKAGGEFLQSYKISTDKGDRWIKSAARVVSAPHAPDFLLGVSVDMTREISLQVSQVLIDEINHRVKNLFTIVSSLIRQGSRSASSVQGFVEDVTARISALARAHDLTQSNPSLDRVGLSELISAVLEPYRGGNPITLTGEETYLAQRMITPLGLIIHEWATNAAKYGGLSEPNASLDVIWSTERIQGSGSRLKIDWLEKCASLVVHNNKPIKPGFGSNLIAVSVQQLGGSYNTEISDGEFRASLEFSIV